MKPEFSTWLKKEMEDRGLGIREFARLAGVASGSISRITNQTRSAGPQLCQAIARALEIPEEEVFKRAGLLQQLPKTANTVMSIYYEAKRLPLEDQKAILAYIRKTYKDK